MRRAFTLIELLAIVAIIAAMTGVGMVSLYGGREGAQVKGAVRDIYAAIKTARSRAIVTGGRTVVEFGNVKSDGANSIRVEINSALVMKTSSGEEKPQPYFVTEWKELPGDTVGVGDRSGDSSSGASGSGDGGESIEEILFSPMSTTVTEGMCLRFQKGENVDSDLTEAQRQAGLSAFSTADYWIEKYAAAKGASNRVESAASEKKEESGATGSGEIAGAEESGTVVWETNGSVEPHKVWIYPEGRRPEDGMMISVDRYGAIKILRGDGTDEEKD